VALCKETGIQKVVDTQESLVQAVAESNLRRQMQTVGGTWLLWGKLREYTVSIRRNIQTPAGN
jgi:hypothetical protein